MKINRRKIIALITLVSMLMACFIPAEGLTLLAPAPEIVIEVEEIDEPDTSGAEKSDKEEGSGNGSAVDEKEADNKDKPGSEPLIEAEKSDKEEGSAVGEKDADNKDKPDSGAPADTEKSEKETVTEVAEKEKETDKPAEPTEAVIDTEKPEKETATEAVIDTEKPEEPKTESPTETAKSEEPETEAPTETAKPEKEEETAKPDVKNQTDLSIASDFVAEVDGTGYADMGEAIAAWANGNTLKLVADASYGSKIIFTNGAHTFDLNGKTFTRTVKSDDGTVFDVNSGAKLTVTDTSAEKNGVITRQQGQYGGTVLFTRDSGSTINFNAGKITGMTSRVIIAWQGSTVNMSGGEISGNTLNNGDAADGIVRTYSSNSSAGGTFNMTGGKIIDNVLGNGKTGGAVYVGSNGTFNLSGNAEISGNTQNGKELNVYLPSGKTISISGALADDTSVGVTMQSGAGVITSGLSGKGAATNFTSDNSEYAVKLNADGEATLAGEAHEHNKIEFTEWTATDSLPAEAGNYCLAGDVTISSRWDVPSGTTNLCLNGHAIIRTGGQETTGSVIQVGSGATLNLYDCGTETRYYTVENPAANGAGLGTVVDKSAYDAADENARGTFTGGYITGGNITGATDNNHLIGGGVNVDCGTFTMYGGTIIGNKVCINGGGVKVKGAGASFTMNGGAILANYNDCYGGAISIGDNAGSICTVNINGGTIAHNWSGRNGGAIHVTGNNSLISCTIAGGNIIDNYTVRQSAGSEWGGALIATFISPKITGTPVIKGNICQENPNDLCVTKGIDLSDHLSSGADVGVSVREPGKLSAGDIMVGINASKDDLQYLHYSGPDEGTLIYCDGTKDWIYKNGELVEFTEEVHHTHEAGIVWATAYVSHEHDNIKFTKWTSTDSLPTTAGNYWLAGDVTISSTWNVPSGETKLCLNGHGIRMTGSGSVVSVGNGAVLNLYDCGTETRHKFDVPDGAGLAALNESGGNYTLNGGYITGGTGLSGQGGGVYVNGGTFTLTAGTIIGNQVQNEGGGVFVASGSFSMNGGAIIYNKSTGHWGGGINVAGPFTMSGGSISHNYAGVGAGGVHCHALTMTGGSVTDNQSASNYAGGVNVSNTATLSGNVNIFGNTNSSGNNNLYCQSVVISDKLSEDASIGITLPNGTGVFTSGLSGKGSAKNFTSDNSAYIVSQNANGEAELKADSHEHDGVSFTKWTATDSLPAEAGNYCLAGDVTISSRWDVPSGTTNLCLNGHAIIRTGGQETTGSVIQVGSGATLNLYDCGTETRYYTVANPTANGAGLGTVVDKSTYDAADENARGTFTGGYITGGNVTGATDNAHLIGGGFNVYGGNFTMYGGTVIGNKVCINGGGVKVKGKGASFTMKGGAILANHNDCYGGAISIGDNNAENICTVNINGGTIARNWSGKNAGALHVDGKGHTITITGGSIVNNYTGGTYQNGNPALSGGGVLGDGGYLQMSGAPVIKDNLQGDGVLNNTHFSYRYNQKFMVLSGLTSGADIGMYVKGLTSSSDVKLAAGAQKEDLQYLHFDIPDEGTLIYCDGTKDWIYRDGEFVEYKNAHHTHEAGTVWATAYAAPQVAVTAGDATEYYSSFGDAVNAWTDGSTLKLLEDVSIDTRITVPAGKHTFDLNGKKFSELSNAGFRVGDGASSITDLTIIDSAGGGVIKHEGERAGSMIWIKEGSSLTLNGGTLEANSTASPVIDFFQQKNATFTMNGGKITGNANNGAVRFANSCVFNMNGGEISGLQTSTGIIDYSNDNGSVINISGSPVVQNNTVNGTVTNFNLPGGKLINISGALTGDALIGVTLAGGMGVFTNGISGKGSADNFTSDNSAYSIYTVDGELMISDVPPEVTGVTAVGYAGDYDGNAHSITVTVPDGASAKYGTEEGSYTLTVNPSYTDAGTYTVYYEVSKEGFDPAVGSATVKIDKVDAAITTAPLAKELIADGTAQELISAGVANGGTVWYALSRDSSASPADSEYKTELPKATDAGAYYVWYLVKGDKNHNDLAPAYVKVTLAEQEWVIISGVVYDSSKTPAANVTVNLTQGSKVVDTIKSDANGGYYFKVPTGLYNLVVKTDNSTTTCKKDISESLTYDIDLLDAGTETALDIIDSDKDVVVDGLNDEARSVREGDNVPADQNVSVKLTVKEVSADGTEGAKKITENAPDKNLEYYDLKVEKSVASTVTTLEETQNVLEIAIPCSFTNKRELTAYDYSASGVKTLTESSSGEAGTFRVDKSNNIMYVYLNHFSTVGIGYKPYYRVKSNVTLGSFSGKVSVALKKEGSDERFELKDVSLDAISFTDVPKGSYQMTITWKDGAEHSLTLPVTIK